MYYSKCHYVECHYAEGHYGYYHYGYCHYSEFHYGECHYAECRYAECRHAECRHAECRGALLSPKKIYLEKVLKHFLQHFLTCTALFFKFCVKNKLKILSLILCVMLRSIILN